MKKVFSLIFLLALICAAPGAAFAQMFTSSPSPLQESSENVVITFHAELSGKAGLQNLPETTNLYAHIGCYTTKSPSTWSHVVAGWTSNTEANTLHYVAPNTYELNVGKLREYFNITDPDEHITKVCVIARNAGGTVQTSDQFIDVYDEGFFMNVTHDALANIFSSAQTVKFTVSTSAAADISLTVNGQQIAAVNGGTSVSASYDFNTIGTSYEVKATAKSIASGEVLTETLGFLYPDASKPATYPGGVPKMGTVRNSDGTVTFCLAAPQKESVILVGSWDNYQALNKNIMNYQDYEGYRYFWTTVSGLDTTTPYLYYYVVDYSIKVGDPYAHLVLDNYNDKWLAAGVWDDRPAYPYDVMDDVILAVYQENLNDYDWKVDNFQIPDHSSLNIYELLLRDFTGTEGASKGNGTLRAAIAKIPYLKRLGINAVELMPIMEFNGNNSWGYNTNYYFAPDKAYGSPSDYKEFIDLCHQNGIAVILDIVFNQSDGLHPWYMMYPIASNPFYNAKAPHDYSVLNDWRQECPLVQQQWTDVLTYWMTEYRVDGFRFDLVKGLGTSYPSGTEAYNDTRVAVMKRLHSVIKAVNPDGIHINENLAGAKEENEMGEDGQLNWSNMNYNSCQYAMGYASSNDLRYFYAPKSTRTIGTTVAYAESHDEERMGYKIDKWGTATVKGDLEASCARLGSVAAQMLMCPGAKMIWQFGELGANQTTKNASDNSNNTSPKTVIWSYLDDECRAGLHDTYMALLHLRLDNPELFADDAEVTYNAFGNSLNTRSIIITAGNKELVVLINPKVASSETVSATTTKITGSNYQVAAATYGFEPTVSFSGNTVSCDIPAHSFVVLSTANVTGIDTVTSDFDRAQPTITTVDGRIVINGDYRTATAYTLSGAAVDMSRSLQPGIYIVAVDGVAHKILVR